MDKGGFKSVCEATTLILIIPKIDLLEIGGGQEDHELAFIFHLLCYTYFILTLPPHDVKSFHRLKEGISPHDVKFPQIKETAETSPGGS